MLLFSFSLAHAGSFTLGPSDSIIVCTGSTIGSCSSLVGGQLAGIAQYLGPLNGGGTTIFSVNDLADATLGPKDLRALNSYTVPTASSYYTQFISQAAYYDELTVSAPGEAVGSTGFVTLTLQVDGTTSVNGQASAGFITQVGTAAPISDIQYFQGNQTLSDTIQIQFGDPFAVEFVLGASTYPTGLLSGAADYSNTATLTGIQVLDSTSNPVSNPSFASASGLVYTVDGVAPEPASWLLLASGLAAVAAFRYRRRFV
jgi:hypothetical protein